jgi:hypothetical protein
MAGLDLSYAQWSTSSRSSGTGQCVEVARNLPGIVAIRDSKDPAGPKLLISSADWRTFVSGIRGGDFSL